jgi:glutaredoxin
MKKTLATSATCGPCHLLKARLEKLELTVEIKNYNDPQNIEWFKKHGIRNVPCLVVETDTTVELILGVEDIIEKIKQSE